ncbi:acyl-CoA dehydrogenase family protein [Streptomyces sp. NPDC058391]|uniref:acyl-CoA dehydrogenase family protein n=1 Tax=Streptomyces sp. NPDC058391 TaxID=3346476 RepID=UPI00365A6F6E
MGAGFTTEFHERLRVEVREFAEREVQPAIRGMEADQGQEVERDLVRSVARRGWIGATIAAKYGGMELGHLAKTIVVEEISRVSGAVGAAVQASQLGAATIVHLGGRELHERWLPAIASGDLLPTIAVTEEQSGGHVLGMEATAVRDGDEYVLNGGKTFVGNSHVGDLHGVVVRTGPGSAGLSAFLVEAGTPGLSLGPLVPTMGLHGFSFGELLFDNCRIPAANRIGHEGDGLSVAYSSSVLYGRLNLAAVALGIHQALVEHTAAYAEEQRRYGAPLSRQPVVAQRLGRMQSRLMTARNLAYHAALLLDDGVPCDYELMNAKLVGTEAVEESARDAMRVHGARGLRTDRPIERFFRDAQHLYAPAGTSEVQLLRLAELATGKSRELWSERFADRTARARRRRRRWSDAGLMRRRKVAAP